MRGSQVEVSVSQLYTNLSEFSYHQIYTLLGRHRMQCHTDFSCNLGFFKTFVHLPNQREVNLWNRQLLKIKTILYRFTIDVNTTVLSNQSL